MNVKRLRPKGSILIWSVTMGFVMTSVFFFFASRMRVNAEVQRETVAKQNARAYMESYADYLENPPLAETTINFDGITGTLTQKVDAIEQVLDSGAIYTYTNVSATDIVICWNKGTENGSLLINSAVPASGPIYGACTTSGFGRSETLTAPATVDLQSLSSPLTYKLLPVTGQLTDSKWHLTTSMNLEYGKKVTIENTL